MAGGRGHGALGGLVCGPHGPAGSLGPMAAHGPQLRAPPPPPGQVAPLHWGGPLGFPPGFTQEDSISPCDTGGVQDKECEPLLQRESQRVVPVVPVAARKDEEACHSPAPAPVPVPPGWRRVLLQGKIVYFSPSNQQLWSLEQVSTYLQTDGVCKCGLDCPLTLDRTFNFDPGAPSLPWTPGEGGDGTQRRCRTLPSASATTVVTTTTATTTSTAAVPTIAPLPAVMPLLPATTKPARKGLSFPNAPVQCGRA